MMAVRSRQQSSTDPVERLHDERTNIHFPWSISPFVTETKPSKAEIDNEEDEIEDEKGLPVTQESCPHELKVKIAHEVPWTDLILEIAMTTALANLTNNTTISRGKDVLGYLCFWGLTWWVWASAVTYNVRFRQRDWVHRLAVILQLAVFGALAAFTRDFDITSGISTGSDPNQDRADLIQIQLGSATDGDINARGIQQARLPTLNFRGIAMTMAWSRILLMTQYVIVYIYALRQHTNPNRFAPAILVHIFSLGLSAISFFTSFVIIGSDPTPADNIAKIILWYGALVLELVAHFIPPIFRLKGHVRYSAEGLHSRARILFLIILGQGLDQLTETFPFAVGPTGFGRYSILSLICAAVVLIAQFSLFISSPTLKKRCVRSLIWFFGQFVYTSTVIVLISGESASISLLVIIEFILATANLLIMTNSNTALGKVNDAVFDISGLVDGAFPNMPYVLDIPDNDFEALLTNGISPELVLNVLYEAESAQSSEETFSVLGKLDLSLLFTVAEEFKIEPKRSEPLYWDIRMATSESNMLNTSYYDLIYEEFNRAHASSVTWFPTAGGATLIFTALLRYIRQQPRDLWEWVDIGTIGGAGVAYAFLTILDIGSSKPIVSTDVNDEVKINSLIFKFAGSGWLLPSFAILNIVLLIAVGIQSYFARQSKESTPKSQNSTVYESVDKAHPLREVSRDSLSQRPVLDYMQHVSDKSLSGPHHNLRRESPKPFIEPFSIRRDSGVLHV